MLKSVEGFYKEGKVELPELPAAYGEGKVLVIFLDQKPEPQGIKLHPGMFPGACQSTEEDFMVAEWRGQETEL